jgi:hypothetical protein
MSAAEQRNKDAAMAAHLKAHGFPHGKRASSGLSNIPDTKDKGSAAYRRRAPGK